MNKMVSHSGVTMGNAVRPDGSIATPVGGQRLIEPSPQRMGDEGGASYEAKMQPSYSAGGKMPANPGAMDLGSAAQYGSMNNRRFSSINQANGGVGVTYSNVVIGGGLN